MVANSNSATNGVIVLAGLTLVFGAHPLTTLLALAARRELGVVVRVVFTRTLFVRELVLLGPECHQ
jgi:hypothetical protein